MIKAQIFIAGISLIMFVVTIVLIKRRILREEYSVIWIISELVLLIFGILPGSLNFFSAIMGVYYLTAIFIIAFLFLLFVSFYYSIILSRLSDANRTLSQEVALLKEKMARQIQ